ncbi:MAG: hypothetical protein MJZ74_10565 [Muribaculaceae bacterium]|nr:hypothetical protein [Muribaculaceae bacterium]
MKDIINENNRRNAALKMRYDPMTGEGCCGERVQCGELHLPAIMLRDHPDCLCLPKGEFDRLRIRYDFEYWAVMCATIKDKTSSRNVKLRLNMPQRRLLAEMERQRQAGQPVRVILLKARQWGGSTLVQMYMAWLQIVIHKQWNSLICGHLKQTSYAIKRMYNTLLRNYPKAFVDKGVKLQFRNFEGSSSVQHLEGRDCLLILGTSRSEDAVRGYDLAMAHLTEVAFWAATPLHSPQDVMRSVSGTVSMMADTVVVYESTANGVGNFFHDEWLRAKASDHGFAAVFVPWHEIEIYRMPVDDARKLWESMDEYEHMLWDSGCTLEMINWYHHKREEYATQALMMAEFPSNDIEAFVGTSNCVFGLEQLDAFACDVSAPSMVGDIVGNEKSGRNVRFEPSATGLFKVWKDRDPEVPGGRYMVVVDVGGRSAKADYSVIMVMDTHRDRGDLRPEVVAQWRGHIDHDLLAWKALCAARYYNNALLVIESNTLETESRDMDAGEFVLNQLSRVYGAYLYHRSNGRPGFQTNRRTKPQAIYALIKAVRDRAYVEREQEAINEMVTYERTAQGTFEAKKGHHDDIVMTRAIAMAVMLEMVAAKCRSKITETDKDAMANSPNRFR